MDSKLIKIVSGGALICGIAVAGLYGLLDKYGDSLLNIYARQNNIEPPAEVTIIEKVIVQATKDPVEPKIAKAITSLFVREYTEYDKVLHLVTIAVMKGENLLLIPAKLEDLELQTRHLRVCAEAHWSNKTLNIDCSDPIEFLTGNVVTTLLANNTPITVHIKKDSLNLVPKMEINFPLN